MASSLAAEVAVVGLGAWGAAALWRLAARGVDVIGIDQFPPGHELGSSHGRTRMFRTACLEHPGLVPLARRSAELWEELASVTGTDLVAATGGVLIGPGRGELVTGTLAAARAHQLPVEVWDAGELRRRLPQHGELPAHHRGVWDPQARLLRAEAAVAAAVAAARKHGARVLTGARVSALATSGQSVEVRTDQQRWRVRQVVVAAGPWLPSLLPGLPVRVARMPQLWFHPAGSPADTGQEIPEGFRLAAFPVFLRQLDDGEVIFGHGAEDDGLLKLGREVRGGEDVDPDSCERAVGPADWLPLVRRLSTAVPGMAQEPAAARVCLVTRTPDRQFLLGRPGGDARVVVAGGDSGHGFKHATGIGEAVADLVLGKEPAGLEFMDPNRFR